MKFLKDFKLIICFTVVLLLLSLLSFWDESKTKKETQEEKVKDRIVETDVSVKDVISISIVEPKSTDKMFSIEKKENSWKLKSSVVDELAEPMVVDGFIQGVLEAKYSNDIGKVGEEDSKLKDYGLDDPSYKMSLALSSGNTIEIKLGGSTPIDSEYYLQVGDSVYVVSEYVKRTIERNLEFFRDKRVIKIDESRIKGLSFIYNKNTINFIKENDSYKIQNSDINVDQSKVKEIIRGLNDNFVSSFIDKPSTIESKLNKFLDLTVKDIEDKEIKITFSEYDNKVYFKFRGRNIIYESSYSLKNLLVKEVKDFEVKKEEPKKEGEKENKVNDDHDHGHSHNHNHNHNHDHLDNH